MLRSATILVTAALLGGCSVSVSRTPAGGPAASAAAAAAAPITHGATAAQIAAVDSAMAPFSGDTVPGAVVGIVRGGELVFAEGYGMANMAHGVPFDRLTLTNIGSTAKQFTAFGILLLEQRGQLSLDDDVRRHLPELKDFGQTVTLRHLLTHTSGYREFVNLLMVAGRQVMEGDYVARSEIVDVVQRQPALQNDPGAEFNYNNTGYGLLALVIERVTGSRFDDWLAREVFRPLGMHDTHVRQRTGAVMPRAAPGYRRVEGVLVETRDIGAAAGAGAVYTTVGDLARWLRNFRTGELGGPELIAAMTTPTVLTGGTATPYGLGIMMDSAQGLRRWHHGGGDIAHRSHFYYYPDLDAGYLVLSNNAAFPGSIPNRIARIFFGEHMPAPTAAAPAAEPAHVVPPETLDRYVGRFALDPAPNFILTVSRDGDRLQAQGTGQPAFPLRAVDDTTFAIDVVNARLAFHPEPDGSVRRLTLHQGGASPGATRIPEEPPPAPAQFAGRYFSAELETHLTVAVEDGRLTVRHRRYGPITLNHVSGDRFSGTLPIGEAVFERDAAGRVTGLRVNAGERARDLLFERVE
jgi:CubicO group peptidase (beta-lactamase class C family)